MSQWRQFWLLCVLFIGCVSTPITGKRAFIITTENQEKQQGEQAYREILSKERETSNSSLSSKVRLVGERIAAVANRPDYAWEFHTLESKEPNAFCLPGGKIAVYTGIIPYADNEAGLAAVMGHEVGHALARHAGQRISQQLGIEMGFGILEATALQNSKNKGMILGALGAGATLGIILPYSRGHESEADEIGLHLMAMAGYDPREAPLFWDRFSKASEGRAPPEFLSTHPGSAKRRDRLSQLLPAVLPLYEQARVKYGAGSKL